MVFPHINTTLVKIVRFHDAPRYRTSMDIEDGMVFTTPGYPQRQYAVTVNIRPNKLINKKPWLSYTAPEQIAILERIHLAFERDHPTVTRVALHYETCPIVSNIHFHALYLMEEHMAIPMRKYYERICDADDKKTLSHWRSIDMSLIISYECWLKYIRKDIKLC